MVNSIRDLIRQIYVALAGVLFVASSFGQTLAPESLLCESDEQLRFVADYMGMKDRSGKQVMEATQSLLKIHEGRRQIALTIGPAGELDRIERSGAPYRLVQTKCALSASSPVSAQVVDSRPISGVVLISISFSGRPARLWTRAFNIIE